jgi:hypothetical protein
MEIRGESRGSEASEGEPHVVEVEDDMMDAYNEKNFVKRVRAFKIGKSA